MKLFFVLLILFVAFIGTLLFFFRGYAKSPKALSNETAPTPPDWIKNAVIYEIFIRDFTPAGNISSLTQKLLQIKEMGVTVIWLMPIHPIGEIKRKGSVGSPYSVKDYYEISPDLGTKADFKIFVQEAHQLGLRVMLDWVGNHTSWDHVLMKSHPEYYKRDSSGSIIPPMQDWSDVAALDYSMPELRTYMAEAMLYWVKEFGIDGYRCDVAEMVPFDFWKTAFESIRAVRSDFCALAEGTTPELHLSGFNISYSWNLYEAIKKVFSGKEQPAYFDKLFESESKLFPKGSLRLRFMTNHDKQLEDGTLMEVFHNKDAIKAAGVLVFTVGGAESIRSVPLFYNGDEVLNARKLSLFEKAPILWNTALSEEFTNFYKTLATLRKKHPSLSSGKMTRVKTSSDETVYAFLREEGKDKMVVIINVTNRPFSGFVRLDPEKELHDAFTPERILPTKDGNLKLNLEEYEFRIFHYR
ncbi:MAG: alpha-amylase family glycosyl hydrolase [Chloroherpetonaceae bacterium]|nr:alpha-amylase family glycosyl hydrolase [Chloroherpetonaceae bacterium]